MNSFRYWYLKHFNPDRALEELRKPVEGAYVVVHDGPSTWVRVRADELDEYMRYLKEKGMIYLEAYRKYAEGAQTVRQGDRRRLPPYEAL